MTDKHAPKAKSQCGNQFRAEAAMSCRFRKEKRNRNLLLKPRIGLGNGYQIQCACCYWALPTLIIGLYLAFLCF